jgi:hypothetical protein
MSDFSRGSVAVQIDMGDWQDAAGWTKPSFPSSADHAAWIVREKSNVGNKKKCNAFVP